VKLQQAFADLENAIQRPIEAIKPPLIENPPAQAMKEKQP
jgi:hypothetical protein